MAGALLGLALLAHGCRTAPTPDLRLLYGPAAQGAGPERTPVIVIPGILGSRLEAEDGQEVWGAFVYGAADADTPEGARLVALPMHPDRPLSELRDNVSATLVLDNLEVDVGFLRSLKVKAYVGIMKSLSVGKYTDPAFLSASDLDYGGKHFTCFQLAYDWRRDISELTATLHESVLAAQRGAREARELGPNDPVKVDIVAHSMGGLLLRYYLRYGTQPMPADGGMPQLTWEGARNVRRAILVGTPSMGSIESLQQLVDGLDLSPLFPNYRPSVLGTMPAIYQLLPRARHELVVDEETGQPIDIFELTTWEHYGWGLLNPDDHRTLEWLLPDMDQEERKSVARDHLERSLARAAQFHRALDIPAELPPGTEIALFAGDSHPTMSHLEVDAQGRLKVAAESPGDGTVPRSSALGDERTPETWEPGLRSPVRWDRVQFLATDHLGMTSDPAFTNNLLWMLLESE